VTTTESKIELEQLIFRLERNHRCVLRTRKNLNSYRYEPKDYECFVKLRDLKTAFSKLAKNQLVLFDEIQHRSLQFNVAAQMVEDSIQEYHKLEKVVATYQSIL